jgi:molybdopterin-binding protein
MIGLTAHLLAALPEPDPESRIVLDAGFPLTALLTRESCRELNLWPGSVVYATFKATAVHVIPGKEK